ncbi:hypothetical protein CON64_00570 [Bacillus pseudomycoides]|nr:hypothetical protein CON64_00570 [Bacillus pseudomycoides]
MVNGICDRIRHVFFNSTLIIQSNKLNFEYIITNISFRGEGMTLSKKMLHTTNKFDDTYQIDDTHHNSQHFPKLGESQENDARLQNGTGLSNTSMAKIYTTALATTLENVVVLAKENLDKDNKIIDGLWIARLSGKNEIWSGIPLISANAAGPSSSGHLIVSFKIAGLGDNVTTTATASAYITTIYACINKSGNFPDNLKITEVSGLVSASAGFTTEKNEKVTKTLTLYLPAITLECPLGQEMVLVSVSYTNVQVSEPNVGTEFIEGIFERIIFEI